MGLHLLVLLHFPADHPEGIGRGIVIDLDSTEGLGACASRQPPLVAVIVKHHSGPAGADDCLTARKRRERERGWLAKGEHGTLLPRAGHLLRLGPPGRFRDNVRGREGGTHQEAEETDLRRPTDRDWEGKNSRDRTRQTA